MRNPNIRLTRYDWTKNALVVDAPVTVKAKAALLVPRLLEEMLKQQKLRQVMLLQAHAALQDSESILLAEIHIHYIH